MTRYLMATLLIVVAAFNLFVHDTAAEDPAEQTATRPATETEAATTPADDAATTQPEQAVTPTAEGKVAYSQDFENEVGAEWSETKISVTPLGKRKYLGQFAEHKVALKLDKLPDHKYVQLSFDLFIIMTWEGNDINCPKGYKIGPDTWTLCIDDAPPLIDASIVLYPYYKGTQSYPDTYTFASYAIRTGADENNSLGYKCGFIGMDAVFHIDVIVPHAAASAVLTFAGTRGTQDINDESWGLDNVKVTVYESSPVGKLDADRLKVLWSELCGGDPMKANKALWTLIGAENAGEVTKLLIDNLQLLDPANEIPPEIARLIAGLDDDSWQVRENSTKALKEMGDKIVPILRRTLTETKSAEVRQRIHQILAGTKSGMQGSEAVVASRIARVLRVIGGEETSKALESLEKQYPQLKAGEPAKETAKPEQAKG